MIKRYQFDDGEFVEGGLIDERYGIVSQDGRVATRVHAGTERDKTTFTVLGLYRGTELAFLDDGSLDRTRGTITEGIGRQEPDTTLFHGIGELVVRPAVLDPEMRQHIAGNLGDLVLDVSSMSTLD